MTQQDLDRYKQLLLKKREELRSTLANLKESARPVELDQSRLGRLSRMDAMQAQAVSAEAASRIELELQRTDAALDRIERGRFGDCAACKQPIDPARLESNPAAFLCIACASRM